MNSVVAGAQRPVFCTEYDVKVFRAGGGGAVDEFHPRHVGQVFGRLLADVDFQGGARRPHRRTTVFGVEVQDHHVAPVIRIVQGGIDQFKRVVNDPEDVTLDTALCFCGIENQGSLELVLPQLFAKRRVFGAQGRRRIWLRHGRARDACGARQQQVRDATQ